MALTRLTGGLTPADPADPRTFPGIYNALIDHIEALGSGGVTSHNDLTDRYLAGQHSIASITDLQTTLDGKQAAGSYAPTVHTHAVADINITGVPNGTRFLRDDGSWATPPDGGGGGVTDHSGLTGRNDPDQHSIGSVTGLQGALDGKQATGNYVLTTDSRLSDARTPTAHGASHGTGGSDPVSPASIGAVASSNVQTLTSMTQAAFDALGTKDAATLYAIV